MLDNFFEALYNKVLINIVVKRTSTNIYIEIYSKKAVIDQAQESFDSILLTQKMIEFIKSYTKESPYFYISVLDMSAEQGALPTCEKNRLSMYADISAAEYKCHDKSWTYYTSKTDLYAVEKHYAKIGVDFVFSPFSIISNFFKDKISTNVAMFLLIQEGFISLSIFEQGKLLYAEHLDMDTPEEINEEMLSQSMDDEDIDLGIEEGIDLEDVDVLETMEDLDDFGDIEDLDSLEEIDEFSQEEDIEEELAEAAEAVEEPKESSFNEDYQRFSLIQTSLSHFYNDEKYESQFIENVYIADSVGVSNDLKHYLEEEMFLNVYVRHMKAYMEVCELTKMELGL